MRWIWIPVLLAALGLVACGSGSKLTGTQLGSHDAAPDFHLRDASGQAVSLDQYRGKVVVLTFLYTHCQDSCPITAELLRHADAAAGHPSGVQYLAVSVDPLGDTPESISAFSAEHHLNELGSRWRYVIGSRQELQGVWKSYYLYVPEQLGGPGPDHQLPIYFIDKQGNRRLLDDLDVTAEQVATNILALIRE